MRFVALVRREVAILLRSPGVWIALLTFAVVLALGTLLPALAFTDPAPRLGAAFLLSPATDIVLPLIAIVFGHSAIAARRETGELAHLLTLPYRRVEVLLGIWLGRVTVVASLTAVGILPALVTLAAVYGELPWRAIAGFVAATIGAAVTYTAVSVAVSAAVETRLRALGITLGGYVTAYALWEPMLDGARLTRVGAARSRWLDRLEGITPLDAYATLADAALPATSHVQLAFRNGALTGEQGAAVAANGAAVDLVGPLLVLGTWLVLPTAIAILRFDRVDLL